MAAGPLYICLSFSLTFCSIFTSPLPWFLRKKADRGCTLSEWERATAVMGTAVGRPFSVATHFCNDAFCYKFPKLLNRFRPVDTLPDPPDVQCADVYLKKGQQLHPLGSPDGEHSVFLPYTPRRPLVPASTNLSLCLKLSLLPPYPFNHSFIKAPLKAEVVAEPDDASILKQTREQSHMQGSDPMSRQFAEVLINIGVEQVNSQKYKEAIKTFNLIMGKAGLSAGVLVGRGTALALAGNLIEAIEDYSKAIQLDPRLLDGWRRRAQARTAYSDFKGAAEDYTKCIELTKAQDGNTLELLLERSMVYMRARDSYRAAKDLRAIATKKPNDAEVLLSLSQNLQQLGEPAEAAAVLERMVKEHPYHKVLWTHLGTAYRDAGEYKKAKDAFQQAIRLDPNSADGFRLTATVQFRLGDQRGALKSAQKALQLDSSSVEARYIKGTCLHLGGDLSTAVREYDVLLSLNSMPDEQYMVFLGFYQREVAAYTASKMQEPLYEFDVERHFPAEFKELWATRQTPTSLLPGYAMQHMGDAMRYTGTFPAEGRLSKGVVEGRKRLVKAADSLGTWIQALLPGTAPNHRLMRAAGMAAIDIMQTLRIAMGGAVEEAEEDEEDGAVFGPGMEGWRDLYERAVQWMGVADPTNSYIWVDGLTPREFTRGFGVTAIFTAGHHKNLQYYPLLGRALGAVKEEILDTGQVLTRSDKRGHGTEIVDLDPAVGPQIEFGESTKELWGAVGQDFLVVTPCYSMARNRHILNGTTISLSRNRDDDGYHFAARTILTPDRWRDYDKELTAAYKHLLEVLSASKPEKPRVLSAALRLAFYWYNFQPLAHGSAMAGHVGLLGTLLAADLEITKKAKAGTQLDWDAILTPVFEDFKIKSSSWMLTNLKALGKYAELISVHSAFPTVSTIIQMLDVREKS